jgi:hypothetical protein
VKQREDGRRKDVQANHYWHREFAGKDLQEPCNCIDRNEEPEYEADPRAALLPVLDGLAVMRAICDSLQIVSDQIEIFRVR